MVDVAIVGAGVLGLAHAYHLARQGKKVVVCERSVRAQGASIRNFGMLWPIGQPAGERLEIALRSREHWLSVLRAAGIWHDTCGSLHLAYADDEAAVIQELLSTNQYPASWLDKSAVLDKAAGVVADGLRGALWSESEICVDPRAVIATLPQFLAETYGVEFRFGTTVFGFENETVATNYGSFTAQQLIVCGGDDVRTLYPEALADPELVACKLQMMRTAPAPEAWRIGPMLAAGLTLGHYTAFASCPSLPALKARFAAEYPEYEHFGIHVLVSQNGQGELTLGDSHEYGDAISIFDNPHIDQLVLNYLATFLDAPVRLDSPSERWHGIYLKHRLQPWFIANPAPNVTVVTGVGGAGMTLSFGLAERVTEAFL